MKAQEILHTIRMIEDRFRGQIFLRATAHRYQMDKPQLSNFSCQINVRQASRANFHLAIFTMK